MISQPVSIGLETYTTLIERENLGEAHPTLVGGKLWYPPDLRHSKDQRILDELHEQGLARGDHLSDDFIDTLTVMQRAAVEYYTYASLPDGRTTYRTACIGRDALLIANRFGGPIEIEPIPYDQMRIRLAAALPATPAARVHSAACSLEDLKTIHDGKSVPQSNSGRDAKRVHRWMELEHIARGPLHAAIREGFTGGRRASGKPTPLWIDTEEGRVLVSHNDGWVNLTSADMFVISDQLSALEEQLRKR